MPMIAVKARATRASRAVLGSADAGLTYELGHVESEVERLPQVAVKNIVHIDAELGDHGLVQAQVDTDALDRLGACFEAGHNLSRIAGGQPGDGEGDDEHAEHDRDRLQETPSQISAHLVVPARDNVT